MARFTLNKNQRLKKRSDINNLFLQRRQISKFPLKCYWALVKLDQSSSPMLFSVSVPKRNFKKAPDRNLIKRRIREAYRLNQHLLIKLIPANHQLHLMFVFNDKTIAPYLEIEIAIISILSRLGKKL